MNKSDHIKVLEKELKILKDRWEPHLSKTSHTVFIYITDRIRELKDLKPKNTASRNFRG